MIILNDYIKNNELEEVYKIMITNSYNFTNGVPKTDLYIRLDPDAPQDRRDYISNGVRAFFRNDQLFILDLKMTLNVME